MTRDLLMTFAAGWIAGVGLLIWPLGAGLVVAGVIIGIAHFLPPRRPS